jgi:prepilin-type N-terminal cleavage/methylation domain-containing protein
MSAMPTIPIPVIALWSCFLPAARKLGLHRRADHGARLVRVQTANTMQRSFFRLRDHQKGFSLVEMLFATVILLVGLVAVAQLVPASILLNHNNRMDSSALVFGQRQLDILLDQPLNPPGNIFTDLNGNIYQLGNPAAPNVVQGANVVSFNNQALIDFSGTVQPYPTNGYGFTYLDPSGITYDVRWAVIITGNGSVASSKRFILGVRQIGVHRQNVLTNQPNDYGYLLPINLDTMVSK